METELKVTRLKLSFRPLRVIRLEGWSGVYAGKMFYDALTRAGCVVESGGFFRVTPIWSSNGVLVGGALTPGEIYRMEAIVWGRGQTEYAICFTHGVSKDVLPVEPVSLEVREERLTITVPEDLENPGTGEVEAVVHRVRHYPTYYRFHGAVVAYPSPRRLLASAARRIIEAMGGPEAAGTIADQLKKATLRLAEHVELYKDNTRRQKVRISHGKDQPVFHGTAEYIAVAPKPLIKLYTTLLQAAKLLGLGGSPGLGLGHVADITPTKPRHELPKPVTVAESDTLV